MKNLGIVRDFSDEYFDSLSSEDIANLEQKLGMSHLTGDKIKQLKQQSQTRYLKLWHDHSSISGHGYLLVLVSVIYDPAFVYTTEEMKAIKGVDIIPTYCVLQHKITCLLLFIVGNFISYFFLYLFSSSFTVGLKINFDLGVSVNTSWPDRLKTC